jgi:peptidoglycan hydrolase-like protein with peptidoglycan-binding domain
MSASIGGSVGREGENREPDVELVQKLLAARGFDPGLADGICGPLTIGAIVSFQRGFLRQPDGLIEVGGTSWRRLTNGAGTPATPSPAADWSGDSARWPQEKKLASLNPPFWAKVETVLTRLRGRGFKPRIVFGWRSVAVQQELYQRP